MSTTASEGGEVLARRATWAGPLVAGGFGLALAALGGFALASPKPPPAAGAGLVGAGLLALAAGVAWRVLELRRRVWVRVGSDTFGVRDSSGEAEYADAEVMSMAVERKKNYSNGEFKSVTRTLTLWTAPATEGAPAPPPMTMVNVLKIGEADPLGTLLVRLNERLVEQARGDMRAGYAVPGDGWTLDDKLLSVTAPGRAAELARGDISAVDVVDDEVCVWTKGRDDAAAKIPLRSANAYLLLQLLGEELQARKAGGGDEQEPGEGGGLGRIIFERRSEVGGAVLLGVVAVGAALLAAALVAFGAGLGGPVAVPAQFYLGAGAALFAGGLAGVGAYDNRIAFFRCHELGVRQRKLAGTRQLRYDEVESFRYAATRMYHNGVYTGSAFHLSFTPVPEVGGQPIAYGVVLRNADEELDQLRDHVSRVLASRMLKDLRAGQTVRWTANLAFAPEGIEYRPSGWTGRKPAQLLPYSEFERYHMQAGVLYLYERGAKKAVASEQVGAANFFPGFLLLTMMTEGAAAD